MRPSIADEVRKSVKADLSQHSVVVMPDFFVDRIISLPSLSSLIRLLREKTQAGGGSIRNLPQMEIKGGNAVNMGHALGRLGVRTEVVTVALGFSKTLLQESFRRLPTVRLRIVEGRPGYTVALEFEEKGVRRNVMLSDLGDVASFGPDMLDKKTLEGVSKASAVALVNWAANLRSVELSRIVFERAKGPVRFVDPADFTLRRVEFTSFLKEFSSLGLISHLSVNENEARMLCRSLATQPLLSKYSLEDVSKACKGLSDKLSITVDVHTPRGSASSTGGEVHFSPCPRVRQGIVTGAGDVWDAANLFGYLADTSPEARLLLANMAASFYVSNPRAEAPTRQEILSFLENRSREIFQPSH